MALGPEKITRPVDDQEVSPEIRDTADVIEAAFDSAIKLGQYTVLDRHFLNGISVELWFEGLFPVPLRDEIERRYLRPEKGGGKWKLVKLMQTLVDKKQFCLDLILLNPPERDMLRAQQYLNLLEENNDRLFRTSNR